MADKRKIAPATPFTPKVKAAFLTQLATTGTIRGAASRAGIHFSTVYEHAKADQSFAEAIERARSEWEQSLVESIYRAGHTGTVIERRNGTKVQEPGDWRALAWLLEHAPATRERYAGIMRQKVELGGDPDGVPLMVDDQQVQQIEIGPDTMERLSAVVGVLLRAGKLRLPDPGEVEGKYTEVPNDPQE